MQGVLRSQSSSKYFGETKNNKGDWIDYISSPEKEYIISNFFLTDIHEASWSGQINLRFKVDDPNYAGPGVYDLKLRRFTGNSNSSAGDSNWLQINLTAPIPAPTPTPTPIATPTNNPSPSSTPTPKPSIQSSPTPSVSPSILPRASEQIGTVAGESTEINLAGFGVSPTPATSAKTDSGQPLLTLNRSRAKIALLLGSGLTIISVAGYFGYRKYKAVYNLEE
jgi:hypothetical protein